MSNSKKFEQIQAALKIEGDIKLESKLLSGKEGVFLEVSQLEAIETSLATEKEKVSLAEAKVTTAEGKVTTAEAAVKSALNEVAIKEGTSMIDNVNLLKNKLIEYGGKAAAAPTVPISTGDVFEPDSEENSTSIFDSFK